MSNELRETLERFNSLPDDGSTFAQAASCEQRCAAGCAGKGNFCMTRCSSNCAQTGGQGLGRGKSFPPPLKFDEMFGPQPKQPSATAKTGWGAYGNAISSRIFCRYVV